MMRIWFPGIKQLCLTLITSTTLIITTSVSISIIIFIGVLFKVFLKVAPMAAAIMVKVSMHYFDVHGPERGNPNMTWRVVTLDIPSSARVVIRHFIHWYRRRPRAYSYLTRCFYPYTSCKTQCCQNTQQANYHFSRSRGTSLTKFASHFFFSFSCFICNFFYLSACPV